MNIFQTPIGRYAPGIMNVVVEIPKGSRKRYRYHRKRRAFVVDYRLMVSTPGEYGWVPETWAKGGKRVNAVVLARKPTWGGNVCEARPIGALRRRDGDHQIISVLLGEPRYEDIRNIHDLDETALRRIAQFYEPFFPLEGWLARDAALEFLKETHGTFVQRLRKHGAAAVTEREEDDGFPDEFEPPEEDDEGDGQASRADAAPAPPVAEEAVSVEQR